MELSQFGYERILKLKRRMASIYACNIGKHVMEYLYCVQDYANKSDITPSEAFDYLF